MAKSTAKPDVHIDAMHQSMATVKIIGNTGLYFNAMSAKAQRELLFPKKRGAKKDIGPKHDPIQEFRDSIYRQHNGASYLGFPAAGIKGAMATAALETPDVTKSSVNRLIYLPQERVDIWGLPKLRMDVVRQAGMNRTPDVRTRAFLPEWCSEVEIRYITPTLNLNSVHNLLANAGALCGIGDFRVEKGKGGFGSFRLVVTEEDEAEWQRIAKDGDYQTQKDAMEAESPICADSDSEGLLKWYVSEFIKREAA